VAVAEELHFRRAAERLHLTQPPLSKQIRALESEVGATLLHRTRQEVRISPEGMVFLERARDILARVEQAGEAVRQARQGDVGRLDIAYTPSLEIRVVPRVVRRFRRRHPRVDLRLLPQTSAEQCDNLRRGRIDAGFLLLPAKTERLDVRPLGRDALVLVAGRDHELGKCPEAALRKLEGEPFIIMARPYAPAFHDLVISAARAAGVSLRIVGEARTVPENLSLVATGLGVSLLPSAVRDVPWKGVSYCSLAPEPPAIEMGLASRKGEKSGPLSQFLSLVRELYGAA